LTEKSAWQRSSQRSIVSCGSQKIVVRRRAAACVERILYQKRLLMMPLDAKEPAAPSATGEPAQSFEYRGVTVRRIQRVATAVGTVTFAWRARVDVGSRGHSVTANSVAEVGDKIDTILDGKK
jgi:hypothetical protein